MRRIVWFGFWAVLTANLIGADGLQNSDLLRASDSGRPSDVLALLQKGAAVNVQSCSDGYTPLMLAAQQGYIETVRDLLRAGADLKIESKGGWTARWLAIRRGHADVAQLLEEAEKRYPAESGITPSIPCAHFSTEGIPLAVPADQAEPSAQQHRLDQHINQLIANMKGNVESAFEARDQLVAIGSPAVDPLIGILRSGRTEWEAASVLGRIGDRRAVDPLIAVFVTGNWDRKSAAAEALGEIGDPRAVPILTAALKTFPSAANALAKFGAAGIPGLISALSSNQRPRAQAACQALINVRDAAHLQPLILALREPVQHVRLCAAVALGGFRDVKAVESLILAVQDSDISVRLASVRSLGKIGDPKAFEPITSLLGDKGFMAGTEREERIRVRGETIVEASRRETIVEALARISKEGEYVKEHLRTLATKQKWVEMTAFNGAVEPLIEGVKEWGTSGEAACRALQKVRDATAVEPLILALRDPAQPAWVRGCAALTLGEFRDARTVEPLIRALQDPDFSVRIASVRSLGKIGSPRALEPINSLNRDEAVDTLRQESDRLSLTVATPRVIVSLTLALEDKEREVRQAAEEALERVLETTQDARATLTLGKAKARREQDEQKARRIRALGYFYCCEKGGNDWCRISAEEGVQREFSAGGGCVCRREGGSSFAGVFRNGQSLQEACK